MLDGMRRWLGGAPRRSPELAALARWAEEAGCVFKPVRDDAGAVIESGPGERRPWRAEWGASLRSYISGPELRLMAELGDFPRELQMLVINRDLAESLEHAMFEQAVDDVRTRMDVEAPPEARWLVIHPKLEAAQMGELRLRYAALGNAPEPVLQWLTSPLGQALAETLPTVASTEPVVLALGRARLTLRTAMTMPAADRLSQWRDLFLTALEQLPPIAQAWRGADRRSRGVDTAPSLLTRPPEDPA